MLKFGKDSKRENLNEFYSDPVEQPNESESYRDAQMQIDCIKNVLINHVEVPEELVNWLTDAVEKKVMIEHNFRPRQSLK